MAADEVATAQSAQHALGVVGGVSADLRGAGAERVDRVEAIHVEADISGAVADDASGSRDTASTPISKNSSI